MCFDEAKVVAFTYQKGIYLNQKRKIRNRVRTQ